jgi:hypothetical protein
MVVDNIPKVYYMQVKPSKILPKTNGNLGHTTCTFTRNFQ